MGEEAREESVRLIVSRIAALSPEGTPVLVGGDLNSGIDSPIFTPLTDAGLVPARSVSPVTDASGTFNAFGLAPSGIVLDHIFARDVTPVSFQTLRSDYGAPFISDHYPVCFTFEL